MVAAVDREQAWEEACGDPKWTGSIFWITNFGFENIRVWFTEKKYLEDTQY